MAPPSRAGLAFKGDDNSQKSIAAALGGQILSGALKPGERLPSDSQMHATFGVSRVVTREVIKTLAAKGLVVSKVKVGTVVRDPVHWNWLDADVLAWRLSVGLDLDLLKQIVQVRRVVEPAAASLAAINATRQDLARLHQCIQNMASAEHDYRHFASADLQFHIAIAEASHNQFFHAFTGLVETALLSMFSLNAAGDPKTRSATTAKHALIVDAIQARDPDAAGKAMLRTVDDGFSRAQRYSRSIRSASK